jgi:hypothetical protein
MKSIISTCFICSIYILSSPLRAQDALSERYRSLAIQGDLRQARLLLNSPEASGTATGRELGELFRLRFIDAIVTQYRRYWSSALVGEPPSYSGEIAPEPSIRSLLYSHGWLDDIAVTDAETYATLEDALKAQGVHALATPAPPLQDLLVWSAEKKAEFEVVLTDQRRTVSVVFMSDFHSLGWKHYASLGLVSTTAWVTNGTLYCVEWAYDPGTENFDVSYLKHESRHLADLEKFPDLPSEDLEYRAKLTELIFANETQRRLLDDFTAKRAANPDSPHAAANFRVTSDLWRELYDSPFPGGDQAWMSISRDKISRSARRLLKEDTARLSAPAHHHQALP